MTQVMTTTNGVTFIFRVVLTLFMQKSSLPGTVAVFPGSSRLTAATRDSVEDKS